MPPSTKQYGPRKQERRVNKKLLFYIFLGVLSIFTFYKNYEFLKNSNNFGFTNLDLSNPPPVINKLLLLSSSKRLSYMNKLSERIGKQMNKNEMVSKHYGPPNPE